MIQLKSCMTEFCPDEIKDFILELVQQELKKLPESEACRRKELCKAILQANRETGERARIRNSALAVIKDWKAQENQILELEKLGFTITKGKKHYKLRRGQEPYVKILSASPSDIRTGANSGTDFTKLFF